MTARIRPGMGSLSEQLDALDGFLLKTADEVGAVRTENRRLRERIVALAAEVAGLKVALQSQMTVLAGQVAEAESGGHPAAPAHGRGHLRVLNGGAR